MISMQTSDFADYFTSQSVSSSSSKMLFGNPCLYYVSIILGLDNYYHASDYKLHWNHFADQL